MFIILKKFLALHHHLALPGIGTFNVEEAPAQIDIANRIIKPPVSKINFSNEKMPADKILFHFLAQELNMDEVQAIRRFTDFTSQLQSGINDNPIIFEGLGKLKKQSTGVIDFEQETIPAYCPVLIAERPIRKNATHAVRVGEDEKTSDEMHVALQQEEVVIEDRWWIPAIILGLIGIAALIYYYNVLHPTRF